MRPSFPAPPASDPTVEWYRKVDIDKVWGSNASAEALRAHPIVKERAALQPTHTPPPDAF